MGKIIVFTKFQTMVEIPNADENTTAKVILNNLAKDGFIRIYNHIFNCNEIIHIEVTE